MGKGKLSAFDALSRDAGFLERLLCVAPSLDETAILKEKEVNGFSQALLLGESAQIRDTTNSKGAAENGRQSRAGVDSADHERGALKSDCAAEFQAPHDRFQRDKSFAEFISRSQNK